MFGCNTVQSVLVGRSVKRFNYTCKQYVIKRLPAIGSFLSYALLVCGTPINSVFSVCVFLFFIVIH